MELSPRQKMDFNNYLRVMSAAKDDLEFLLENLGIRFALDFSRESLVKLEEAFWKAKEAGIPSDFSSEEHLEHLMGLYLAETIVRLTGAKVRQSKWQNRMFGQPYLDDFGNKEWDRIYPVQLVTNFANLKKTNPNFAGVDTKTVLASVFDKAREIHDAHVQRNT